jgi:hypothetical protein
VCFHFNCWRGCLGGEDVSKTPNGLNTLQVQPTLPRLWPDPDQWAIQQSPLVPHGIPHYWQGLP